jgi:multidrug efflux pump subunit AcrA (membrane-fusion protein)
MKYHLINVPSALWVVLLLGLLLSLDSCAKRAEPTTTSAAPTVSVIRPQRADMVEMIELPGDVVGFYEASLHAKVTGYLKSIGVDKGDTVKAGQVLAEIEVPELHSNLNQAEASLTIARVTYERLKRVQQSDARLVSQEDVDIAGAKYEEAKAGAEALATMVGYTKVIAPFDGVITGRFADPGALIRAGGGDIGVGETSALIAPAATEGAGGHRNDNGPILTLADIDYLRVYVYVPEGSYPFIKRGTPATLRFDEFPGRIFAGTVARYATALDLATRTMLTEVDIRNPNHVLYPRSYAHVTLDLVNHPDALRLPVAAVNGIGKAAHVLVVEQGRLHEAPVLTGINNGNYVEITSGLSENTLVVSTYSGALKSGQKVNYAFTKSTSPVDAGLD